VAEWTPDDQLTLMRAVEFLEHPRLIARLAAALGVPIEKGFSLLPAGWQARVGTVSEAALAKALAVAVRSLGKERGRVSSAEKWHKAAAAASGIAGGAFGLGALAIELPVSTTIILRSIAAIAREEGEDLSMLAGRLQCLQVFAFGGKGGGIDKGDEGYWAIRIALSKMTSEAASFLAERGMVEKGAPPIVRFITAIASRFGTVVSEEVAAKAIPIVGAVGGGTVNYLFADHFQKIARGHFSLRRLERTHGADVVRTRYEEVRSMLRS